MNFPPQATQAGAFKVALIVVALSLLCPPPSAAETSTSLKPGDYVTEGGWGTLTLKPGKSSAAGALKFDILTVGANGHTCSLDGEVRENKATLEGTEAGKPCVVTMTPTAAGIVVRGSSFEACGQYCGARATFETTYFQPPAGCVDKAVTATRKSFKQRYDNKEFKEARAQLEPLLTDCARSMGPIEMGRIRNDLAVTLHKLGDLAGCRALLQPLAEDSNRTDAEIRENYPPVDAESVLPIARAARTNLKLCAGK